MSDASSHDTYQQLPSTIGRHDKNNMLIPENHLHQLRFILHDRPHSISEQIDKQVSIAEYIQALKSLNSESYWSSPDVRALVEPSATDDKVSHVDHYVKLILVHKEYDCFESQCEIQQFVSSIGEELGKLVAQVTHQRNYYKEMIPFTRALKDMVEHSREFTLEVSKSDKLLNILRYGILDTNIHDLIRYQFAEVISMLLRVDVINDKYSDEVVIAFAYGLQINAEKYCSSSHTMNVISGEHVLERLVSMQLLSIYFLCKKGRLQGMARLLFPRLSFLADTLHKILMNFGSSHTRQMALLIMDQILNPDFASLYNEMKLSYSLVRLLGNTYPEVIRLAGRLLLRLWEECSLDEEEKGDTMHAAVVTLFCKNVIAQSIPNEAFYSDNSLFSSTCDTLCSMVNYSEYACNVLSSVLRECNIHQDQKMIDSIDDMKQIRDTVRGKPDSFKLLVELYEETANSIVTKTIKIQSK